MVRAQVLGESVDHGLFFGLGAERAEEFVPDDQHAGVIAIEVTHVRAVVHSVVGGRVEDGFEPDGHAAHGFGVHPELITEIEPHHQQHHAGFETEQGQPKPEEQFVDALAHALAERRAVVEVLGRVVVDMPRPEEANRVIEAMKPVIREVVEKEEQVSVETVEENEDDDTTDDEKEWQTIV